MGTVSINFCFTLNKSIGNSALARMNLEEDKTGRQNQLKKIRQVKKTVEEDKPSQKKQLKKIHLAMYFTICLLGGLRPLV